MIKTANIAEVISLLEKEYGKVKWKPRLEPLDELIYTVLSQNTSDINSERAFKRLNDTFKTWDELAEADESKIEKAIRGGGLFRIKSIRLKDILQGIKKDRDSLSLDFLKDMDMEEARAWLRKFPGVGPKTAACVLVFALGRPAFPVDTHVHRVTRRLGLAPFKSTPEQTASTLEKITPQKYIYQLHVHMVWHGRRVCRARRPEFGNCILEQICPKIGVEEINQKAKLKSQNLKGI